MTVHQAKGMQWPVVFVPALLKNRFPAGSRAARTSGTSCLASGVGGPSPLRGHDRGRAAALLRRDDAGQKFLHLTWAPVPGKQTGAAGLGLLERRPASKYVKRRLPDYSQAQAAAPDSARRRRERRLLVLRPQVLLRVPVPVQAAHPVRLQRADPRGAGLRQVTARRTGRGARTRASRRRRRHG